MAKKKMPNANHIGPYNVDLHEQKRARVGFDEWLADKNNGHFGANTPVQSRGYEVEP